MFISSISDSFSIPVTKVSSRVSLNKERRGGKVSRGAWTKKLGGGGGQLNSLIFFFNDNCPAPSPLPLLIRDWANPDI
jgi:hypothetical protein